MKNPQPEQEITVDGIRYNVAKGKVVEDINLEQQIGGFDSIRKQAHTTTYVRQPSENVRTPEVKVKGPAAVIDLPTRRHKKVKKREKTNKTVLIDATSPGFASYFIHALLPSGFSAPAWIFSVLRGVTSPLAWILVALPIVILQTQNLANENINQLLEAAHQLTQNGVVFRATGAIIFAVVMGAIIIFIRVICNAIALHLRITMLARQPTRLWPAVKLVFHNSLKILVHNFIQAVLICVVCLLALAGIVWAVFVPHGHTLSVFSPYIVGLIIFVWLVITCLLHAKHWLQITILSSSTKTSSIQQRSWQAVAAYPLRGTVLAATSFLLSIGIVLYGVWAALQAITWLNRSVLPSQTRFILLMSSIFAGVVLVGYLQQTIWSAYASWINTQYKPTLFVIANENQIKKTKIWPIWVSTYLFTMIISLMVLGIIFALPSINTWVVNVSQKIPARLEIPKIDR